MSLIEGKVVAIHQPNFFPWLGYFDKILRSDTFVFLDNVLYPKSGSGMGTWSNRVKLLIQGQAMWLGCSVVREHGEQLIKDVRINTQVDWKGKFCKTLKYNYSKALFYKETMKWLEPLVMNENELLVDYNILAIQHICSLLGLKKSFVRQSELNSIYSSTDLLIEITQVVGGSTYLCGGGAQGYQDDELFAIKGIGLLYQNFVPIAYPQLRAKEFVAGLSIIDAFMNSGIDGTRNILFNHAPLILQENHSC